MSLVQAFVPPFVPRSEFEDRLVWLVLLRWFGLAMQTLAVMLAYRLDFISAHIFPFLLVGVVFLLPVNLWACRSLYRTQVSEEQRQVEILGLLLLDLMQFLFLLSLTEGIHNPFYPLLYVYTLLGAMLLPRKLGWGYLLTLAVGIYLLNPVVYVFNAQQTYIRLSSLLTWMIQFSSILALWWLASSLSRRLLAWRRQAEHLRAQQESLQKLYLMGALGAGVAHEFATPINTLRLRLERMKRQYEEGIPQDLLVSLKALEQCELRLRNMAALPSQADLEHQDPLLVEPYFQKVLAQWQSKQTGMQTKRMGRLPVGVYLKVPELVLRQALSNLLDNAAQAMQGEGLIEVSLSVVGQFLQLEIQDQGPGWPSSVLEHLGEPFITTRKEGTGLGLYTVYMLAQSLGGSLVLKQNDKGAVACLCLPMYLP